MSKNGKNGALDWDITIPSLGASKDTRDSHSATGLMWLPHWHASSLANLRPLWPDPCQSGSHSIKASLSRSSYLWTLSGLALTGCGGGREDGATGTEAGTILTINWIDGDHVSNVNSDGTLNKELKHYFGEYYSDFDFATNQVTDLSLVRNYFGEGFADGLQVLPVADLGYDII